MNRKGELKPSPQGKQNKEKAVGVRYITEDLIRKVSKQNGFDSIVTLNLTLSKDLGKKIRYIENLEKCRRIRTLILTNNIIEKIEKLDKLTTLRELNLAYNNISKIEGLETLTSLQVLSLTGNKIESIPAWFPKKLTSLQVCKLAKNNFESLQELSKLRHLKNLIQLTVGENPVCKLPHCRQFLVFHLRTLESLDGQAIPLQERQTAQTRFAQDEVDQLEEMLLQKEAQLARIQEQQNRSAHDLEERGVKDAETKEMIRLNMEKIHELENELTTKNDLLKRKTGELTKACEKHYELEQELAFYKIDHKFDTLGKVPSPDSGSGYEDGGLIGESPYIGKGRFHQDQRARQRQLKLRQDGSSMDSEAREHMHQALDRELEEKRSAVHQAQEHLSQLQEDLQHTADQLSRATNELQALQHPHTSLTEDDKQYIRDKLAKKVKKVHTLRDEAHNLEGAIQGTEAEIERQERHMGQLQGKLSRISSKDALYPQVKREMWDKEQQLALTNQQYAQLQEQLEAMLHTIAKETRDIQRLEQELREGQVAHNEEMKQELEGIIGGLQTYLSDVKEKALNQRRDYDALLRQQEELLQNLHDVEVENQHLAANKDQINSLHQRLQEAENSLEAEREANKSMRVQLDDTRLRELEDTQLSSRLHDAEDVIDQLKRQMAELDKKSQAELESYRRQLEQERRQGQQMSERNKEMSRLQDEVVGLHQQLQKLQAANGRLQDDLYAEKQNAQKEAKQAINPEELRRRLDSVVNNIKTGKVGVRLKGSEDRVGKALGQLQDTVQNELDRSFHDLEKARRAQVEAQDDVARLQEKLSQAQQKERHKAEIAVQTQLQEEQREMEKLKRELDLLKDELERERDLQRSRLLPTHLLDAAVPGRSESATGTASGSSSSEETSSVPSSQWSQRRRDLYDSMTPDEQDLFDELQREIEELRRLLAMRDKKAASKATQAEQKAAQLRDMISSRRRRESERDSRSDRQPRSTKSYSDPRLRQTADELIEAQEEIDQLHEELRYKDQLLHDEVRQSDQSQNTIATQQEEIDRLTTVLEDQRSEITRLADHLERLTEQPPDQHRSYDDELQELRQGTANLRNNLATHGPRIHHLAGNHGDDHRDRARRIRGDRRQRTSPSRGHRHHDRYESSPPRPQHHGERYGSSPTRSHHHGRPMEGYGPSYPGEVGPHPGMYPPPAQHHATTHGMVANDGMAANPMPFPPHVSGPPGAMYAAQPPMMPQGMPTAAPVYNMLPGEPQYMQAPGTPTRHSANQSFALSTPATPLAGSGMGPMLLSTQVTPSVAPIQPIMVSTPINSPAKVKGILKNGVVTEQGEELVCTVPEHHDLEDYISKLQKKVKSLKGKISEMKDKESSEEESRRVVFEDDVERKAVRRLKAELEDRRAELEGLDLAIERQKTSLEDMKDKEHALMVQRKAAKKELEALKQNKTRGERRKTFLNGEGEYDVYDSDYDYEYNPRSRITRNEFLVDEITCLEKTLAKRRAELREADQLLHECEDDLEDARNEAKIMIHKFENAKNELARTLSDAEQIEHRAQETGVELFKTEEVLKGLKGDVAELQELRQTQEDMLEKIQVVIATKDLEFQEVDARVKQTTQSLQEVELQLQEAESLQNHKLTSMLQKSKAMQDTQQEMQNLRKQLAGGRLDLEETDRQIGKSKAQIKLLETTIQKRQVQLETLDKDVEKEIHSKRQEIKSMETEVETMRQEYKKADEDLKTKEDELRQVQSSIEHEEAVLENLATTTNKQRADLQEITRLMQDRESSLERVHGELAMSRAHAEQARSTHTEEDREVKRIASEKAHKKRELDVVKESMDLVKDELDSLKEQRRKMETSLEAARQEKINLEDTGKALERSIAQLKKLHSQAEETSHSKQLHAARLDKTVQEMENDVEEMRQEKDALQTQTNNLRRQIQEGRGELEQIQNDITDAEHRVHNLQQSYMTYSSELEAMSNDLGMKHIELRHVNSRLEVLQHEVDRRQINEDKYRAMEKRVVELETDVKKQSEEKEQLTSALSKSCDDLEALRITMAKERAESSSQLKQVETEVEKLRQQQQDRMEEVSGLREKYTREISELESIAQAHYSRANRLNDELNYLQAEYVEMKRKLASQQEIEEREKRLEETLKELKTDIKAEVTGSLAGMERSRTDALSELEQLQGQRSTIESRLDVLKNNLQLIRQGKPAAELPYNTATSAELFAQQQDLLKKQLEAKLLQQSAMIQSQKQISQDSIRQLQQKCVSLQQVLSQGDSVCLKPADVQNPTNHATNHEKHRAGSPADMSKEVHKSTTPESPRPKRAYSPHRHSIGRLRAGISTENLVPEKGPST